MAQALLSAVGLGLLGMVVAVFLGLRGTDISRHISFGIFSTMVILLAHSMMMFYLIGKGKAVKDAMVATRVAAILGASVDTHVLPPIVHGMLAYGAIACNLAAVKIEIDALTASSRIVDEVNSKITES